MKNIKLPASGTEMLRQKAALKSRLLEQEGLLEKRIAVFGGSTTAEVVEQLEIFLLALGIKPVFYQSEYGLFYEASLYPPESLKNFVPDLVYIHTSAVNIRTWPDVRHSVDDVEALLVAEQQRFEQIWQGIEEHFACALIQNNVEESWVRPLGNLDGNDYRGHSVFVRQLNQRLFEAAQQYQSVTLHDIHFLANQIGLRQWFNPRLWYLFKYAIDLEVMPLFARHLASVMAAHWGISHKALVLDLDNTLWGGVIGDDGVEGIEIGFETAEAEAYRDFQRYVKALAERGVILAVNSKNEAENAKAGLAHPDGVLRESDFASIQANWEPKSTNIERIVNELEIGADSLVFVDDNPVERDIVQAQQPQVTVPDIGNDITEFVRIVDELALFETLSLSNDDLARTEQYQQKRERQQQQQRYENYDEFLKSLDMKAEIAPFSDLYLDRITQLINKTNQFNLTTRRYTRAEVESLAKDEKTLTLYGKLSDKYGDNGLVSVLIGKIEEQVLTIDTWLMSCRVLKRGMEYAMFEVLCEMTQQRGVVSIVGEYMPTAKNKMVKNLYAELGFVKSASHEKSDSWVLSMQEKSLRSLHSIEILK